MSIDKPLSLHWASVALGMVMMLMALMVGYPQMVRAVQSLAVGTIVLVAALGSTLVGTIRYAVELEMGKPRVRLKLALSIAAQLIAIGFATYLGYGNTLFTFAALLDLCALGMLYYPRTTYWLNSVRTQGGPPPEGKP